MYATGSFEQWSGFGVVLQNIGDGIYVGTTEIIEGTEFEYKYVVGGWDNFESGAELGSDCDWNPDDQWNNYGAIATADLELPIYIFGGGCEVREEEEALADMLLDSWKLAPFEGSMRVGNEGPGSGNWWSSSSAEHETRPCLYDDEYVFNSDGTFQNILGDETWLEWWQIEGLDLNEGCGSPIAPHDGAETANWEGVVYNDGESEWVSVNLNGAGAYLGLPRQSMAES